MRTVLPSTLPCVWRERKRYIGLEASEKNTPQPVVLWVAGCGAWETLCLYAIRPGGGGIGMGEPLKTATDTVAERLLDKCLTELLTGSTIKIAQTSRPNRTNMFFVMDEPLLAQP